MAEATCSIDDCGRRVTRHGWCHRHYGNWRSSGDPLIQGACDIAGCDKPTHGTPLCSTHSSRWYRWGDTNHVTVPTERKVIRNRVTKVCVGCGKVFERKASKAGSFNFCSLNCKRANPTAEVVEVECETCGKIVRRYASQIRSATDGKRPWCSRRCQIKSVAVTRVCDACHEPYTLPKHLMDIRRGCSLKCAGQLRWENGPSTWGMFKAKLESGYRTDIEAMAETVLIDMGVQYEFEKRVGRFWIDFTLPDLGIGLECDGWRHETKLEKDADRDRTLLQRGWRIVRIPDAALKADARGAILAAIPELLSGSTYKPPYEQLNLLD